MKRGLGLVAAIAAMIAIVLVGAGCGDSESEPLTKAEFIKQGDKICQKADKRQVAALESFESKNQTESLSDEEAEEKLVETVGLPALQAELEELEDLALPEDDEGQAQAIVAELEKAIAAVEQDPGTLLQSSENPFESVGKLANEYGFQVCGTP